MNVYRVTWELPYNQYAAIVAAPDVECARAVCVGLAKLPETVVAEVTRLPFLAYDDQEPWTLIQLFEWEDY